MAKVCSSKDTEHSLLWNWGWEKLISMTTDGGKNMYGSMASVGWISEGVMHMGSDNPIVFHHITHQEAPCCRIFSTGDTRGHGHCDFNTGLHLTPRVWWTSPSQHFLESNQNMMMTTCPG
jgi:hypothetical protein